MLCFCLFFLFGVCGLGCGACVFRLIAGFVFVFLIVLLCFVWWGSLHCGALRWFVLCCVSRLFVSFGLRVSFDAFCLLFCVYVRDS